LMEFENRQLSVGEPAATAGDFAEALDDASVIRRHGYFLRRPNWKAAA